MTTETAIEDSLCCYCSMCCNGSLFSHAKLDDAERARLGDSVFYEDSEGSKNLQFPCTQLGQNGACQVYESRPAICQAFRCSLLRAHDRDELSLEEAKQLVDDAKEIKARAREAIDAAASRLPTIIKEARISRAMRALEHEHEAGDGDINDIAFKRA
jgi:Fe-S-cluster containining protein